MRKTKLLYLIHGFNTGGAETLVKEYILKIDRQKFDVSIVFWDHYNSTYEDILKQNDVNLVYVGNVKTGNNSFAKALKHLILPFRIKRTIRIISPDIIHSHLPVNSFVKFSHPKKGTKIFHTVHSEPKVLWGSKNRKKDFNDALWLVKKYKMRFITLHEDMKNEVNELFNVTNTVVLNNGIDFKRFDKARNKEIVRKEIGISCDAFVVGHVGRFIGVKNHELIIQAFKKVIQIKKNAFLLLIGDGVLKEKIINELNTEGFNDKYLILSNRNDIPDLLKTMDVFVFPSKYEGLGISLIEAQKMKLPCIVSDTVPKQAQVSNLIKWHSLDESVDIWANDICNFTVSSVKYTKIENWDMNVIIRQLERIYEE